MAWEFKGDGGPLAWVLGVLIFTAVFILAVLAAIGITYVLAMAAHAGWSAA